MNVVDGDRGNAAPRGQFYFSSRSLQSPQCATEAIAKNRIAPIFLAHGVSCVEGRVDRGR